MKHTLIFFTVIGLLLIFNIRSLYAQNENKDSYKPNLLFAGKLSGSAMTINEFQSDSVLHFSDEDLITPVKYEVSSFKINITQGDSLVCIDIPSEGNRMPQRVKDIIMHSQVRSRLYVESIKVRVYKTIVSGNKVTKMPDGEEQFESIMFHIKAEYSTAPIPKKYIYNDPVLIPWYGGIRSHGNISRKDFLADSAIYVYAENDSASKNYEVFFFHIAIIQRVKDPIIGIPSNGNKIPDKLKNIIKEAEAGTKIYFENIKAKLSGGDGHEVGRVNIALTLTDN